MEFSIKNNDTILDLGKNIEMEISKLLLRFLNLDLSLWLDKYKDIVILRHEIPQDLIINTEISLNMDDYYENLLYVLINEWLASMAMNNYSALNDSISSENDTNPKENIFDDIINSIDKGEYENAKKIIEEYASNDSQPDTIDEILNELKKKTFSKVKSKLIQTQNSLIKFTNDTFTKKNITIADDYKSTSGISIVLGYSIEFKFGKIMELYSCRDIESYCLFALAKLYNSNKAINICENCGNFFIPSVRSDEIYCDKIHPNGRSCKQMGYENKINSDDIMKEYRRVYKNKNAIKNRNKKNNSNSEKNFKQWVYAAKLKMEICRDGEISLEEFKEWLENN